MILSNLLLFILSLSVLVVSGSWLVKSGTKLSRFLHIPEFVVGFGLMALATSLPELFVGITSALNKTPAIALGTVIGSNIANLTLIMGVGVLLAKNVRVKTKDAGVDSKVMVIITILPLVLMIVGRTLSRMDGFILMGSFIAYYIYVFKRTKEYSKELDNNIPRRQAVFYSFLFLISLALLFVSADYTVLYGSSVAEEINFPPIFIGLFLIAFGTSLPELVFGIRSMISGHTEMSLGNLIGSNIANIGLILGITAIIFPIQAQFTLFLTAAIYMIIVSLVFAAFVESKKFTSIAGIALIMMYIFFIFIEVYVKSL
jgi:cation:H+ antiporter